MSTVINTNTINTILRSEELSCPSCVKKIEKSLKALAGVEEAKVHFNAGRIEVRHDATQSSADELVKAVQRAGYEARPSAF